MRRPAGPRSTREGLELGGTRWFETTGFAGRSKTSTQPPSRRSSTCVRNAGVALPGDEGPQGGEVGGPVVGARLPGPAGDGLELRVTAGVETTGVVLDPTATHPGSEWLAVLHMAHAGLGRAPPGRRRSAGL